MGVYIAGMEMPVIELEWTIRRGADGKWYAIDTNAETSDGEWHEIVPVPPHGDLIDRDALSKSLNSLCDRVCQYSKAQRKVMCGACPLGDAFAVVEDDAPTIIPAEEGE